MPDAHETDDHELDDLATEVARRARDVAYVAVGLGVLGLQRAQAARHDLARRQRADGTVDPLRAVVAAGTRQAGAWIDGARALVSSQLPPLRSQLPEPARELAEKARIRLGELGALLRQLAAPGA